MSEEKWKSAGEDKGSDQERAADAFCEELLCCYICGKIYFSRRPITLPTLCRRDFFVCRACSHALECSICGRGVSPESTLVVEDLADSPAGILCARCKDRILSRFRTAPRSPVRRLWSRLLLVLSNSLAGVRRLMSIDILPRRKNR